MGRCLNLIYNLVLCFLSLIIFPTVGFLIFLIFVPGVSVRKLVQWHAEVFRKDLGKMVTCLSSILAVDDIHGIPECNVVLRIVLEGRVSLENFTQHVKDKVISSKNTSAEDVMYPELQQYFSSHLGYLFWKKDRNFDIRNHVLEIISGICLSPVDFEEYVERYTESLLSGSWEKRRSPWKFILLPNQPSLAQKEKDSNQGDKTTVLLNFHHGVGDGYAFLNMMIHNMAETTMEAAKVSKPAMKAKPMDIVRILLRAPYDFTRQMIEDLHDFNVWHLGEKELSRRHHMGSIRKIPISKIKEIKNKFGVSFTSVLFAATAGGLRKHFLKNNLPLPEIMRVFVPMPFPGHRYKLRNYMTGQAGRLPLGIETATDRLRFSHDQFQNFKQSSLPYINYYLAKLSGGLPSICTATRKNPYCTGIWSNFPGSNTKVTFFGSNCTDFSYCVASLHGRTGFTFTALSFEDYINLELTIDRSIIRATEVNILLSYIQEEFDNFLRDCV